MTYSYIEGDKFLGQGPNISGGKNLIAAIEKGGKDIYPNLTELIQTGECAKPIAVQGEAERLAKTVKNKNVQEMLGRLANAAAMADKVITISH